MKVRFGHRVVGGFRFVFRAKVRVKGERKDWVRVRVLVLG